MYQDFPEVLRVRDNVVGEIGEYFAVKALNSKEANPVIRLSSGLKNIDAVQHQEWSNLRSQDSWENPPNDQQHLVSKAGRARG